MRSAREATERQTDGGNRSWNRFTRKNFENWLQRILERLDRQDELLLCMKAKEKEPSLSKSVRLFGSQDLCLLLQISKHSLQAI